MMLDEKEEKLFEFNKVRKSYFLRSQKILLTPVKT